MSKVRSATALRSRLAAQGEADVALDVGQTCGSAGPRPGDVGQAFGEDLARALALGAAEPSCLDTEGDTAPMPGQVSQGALVAAMHPAGRMAADRAARRRRLRLGEDDDAVGLGQDLLDQQACRDQRQKAAGQLGTKERRKGSLHVGATTSTPPPNCTKSRGEEPRFDAD